jgi:hypothetical protein
MPPTNTGRNVQGDDPADSRAGEWAGDVPAAVRLREPSSVGTAATAAVGVEGDTLAAVSSDELPINTAQG